MELLLSLPVICHQHIISTGFRELSEQQELLEHGNQVVCALVGQAERGEKQQEGKTIGSWNSPGWKGPQIIWSSLLWERQPR